MTANPKAVVLLSGGLDSQVSMGLAAKRYDLVEALTFNYGQHSVDQEIAAAKACSDHYGCPHRVIGLEFLSTILTSALTESEDLLPELTASQLNDMTRCQETAKAVWVPNRNGLFLNIAACIAEKNGADWLVCGFNREEAKTFPDNSQEFIDLANLFFHFSTSNSVRVWSGTIAMDKTEIVKAAMEETIPLEWFWSCYRGEPLMCGRCESCGRAIRALKANGLWDRYRHRFVA